MRLTGECNHCGDCCRFFLDRIEYPLDVPDMFIQSDAAWYNFHRGVKATIEGRTLIVRVMSPCKHLRTLRGGKTECAIWGHRPLSCIDFPQNPALLKWLPRCGYRFVDDEGSLGKGGKKLSESGMTPFDCGH